MNMALGNTVSTAGSDTVLAWPENLLCYLLFAFAIQIVIRILISIIRNIEYHWPGANGLGVSSKSSSHFEHGIIWNIVLDISGFHPELAQRDWLQSLLLGYLELLAFPVLIHSNRWEGIGLWISLKAVPHWKQWLSHGESYSRFFIGNGLVVTGSYVLSHFFYFG